MKITDGITYQEPIFAESIIDQYKQAMREVLEERVPLEAALKIAMEAIDEVSGYDSNSSDMVAYFKGVARQTKKDIEEILK